MEKTAIVLFKNHTNGFQADLEIPLDISAKELVISLKNAYGLDIDTDDIQECYLQSENPRVLLKGIKTLEEYQIHNGSVIIFTER